MEFDSPVASRHLEDDYDDDLTGSELKESQLYKSLAESKRSESKRSSEDPILNYKDILTDQQTLDFIKKHFSQTLIEVAFNVDSFIEVLLQEFLLRNPSVVSGISDIKVYKRELKNLLKTSLTTNDDNHLSLNALEVNTKSKGLYNFLHDLSSEAMSILKSKEDNKINEAILEELSTVSKMLNSKKEELVSYESRLKDYERSLQERELSLKSILQSEYDNLVKSFEESYKNQIAGIQKRLLTNEKTTKAKIKTFETKIKDFKASSSSTTNNEEKHKFKIASLEKTIEFLKLKTQDLEKKFTLEQEAKNTLTKKNEKLTQKVTTLEKSLREA
jgi:chromosome segregation ATPase